jgi:short subunit fatty acids transporter
MAQDQLNGGKVTAPNRAPADKVIAGALANNRVAQALIAALGTSYVAATIVATATSTTTNFASLAVGDLLIHVPATAGNTSFETVATAGTKPSAAVVGDLYVALRVVNLDANNPLIPPPPAQLTGRLTGDGGLDF